MFDNGFNKQNDTICRFKFLKTRQNFMGGGVEWRSWVVLQLILNFTIT